MGDKAKWRNGELANGRNGESQLLLRVIEKVIGFASLGFAVIEVVIGFAVNIPDLYFAIN